MINIFHVNLEIIIFSLIFISFLILNNFFKKNNILIDQIFSKEHKSFSTIVPPPLSGGIFLIIFFIFFFEHPALYLYFFLFLIFLNGLISDLNLIENPTIRFIFQLIIVTCFTLLLDLRIYGIGIKIIDNLLSYHYLNYIITILCILIAINGFNFIDGLNTLSFGYFLIILGCLIFVEFQHGYDFFLFSNYFSVIFLFFLFLLILKGSLFLGDSGSYLIGTLIGIKIIMISKEFPEISAWYFALLLWYPAFEILFSIIRKFLQNKSPFKPDNEHLHQKIYKLIRKKLSIDYINPLSANLINFFNFIFLIIGSFYIFDSGKILLIILINILVYIVLFIRLKK